MKTRTGCGYVGSGDGAYAGCAYADRAYVARGNAQAAMAWATEVVARVSVARAAMEAEVGDGCVVARAGATQA